MRRLISNTGVVFGALTERDDQLRSLIENSNTVFADDRVARPRAQADVRRAADVRARVAPDARRGSTEFADDTNPLVTQLRPAARELRPTLQDLADARARPQGAVPRPRPADHGVSRRASRPPSGCSRDLRAAARASSTRRCASSIPILEFLGALQARADLVLRQHGGGHAGARPRARALHYLRTTNPLNLENLAVYPQRIGTNRPNPYQLPGGFDQLAKDLPVFENRHCGNGVPTMSMTPPAVPVPPLPVPTVVPVPTAVPARASRASPGAARPHPRASCCRAARPFAPPCELQGKFNVGGEIDAVPARQGAQTRRLSSGP